MTTTNDLIGAAARILSAAPPIDGDEHAAVCFEIEAWISEADNKIERLRHVRRRAEADASIYDDEIAILTARRGRYLAVARHCDSRAEELLRAERAMAGMPQDEGYAIELPNGVRPALRLNPPAVLIEAPDVLPAELWRQPATPPREPDKAAIKAVLVAGGTVPGAKLTRGIRFDWGEPRKKGA